MPNALDDAGKAPQAETTPPEAGPDLESLLPVLGRAATDPELRTKLRESRPFMGFVGQVAHEMAQKMRKDDETQKELEARHKAEQELLDLARTDPATFSERFLDEHQKTKTQVEITTMRNSVLQEYGDRIGKRIMALPEFGQLDQQDNDRIMAALNGLPVDEVVGAYAVIAVDVIADKRAKALHEKWKAEALPKEAKALATEQAAKERARQAKPSVQQGTITSANPEPDWRKDPKGWDAWYERTHPGARRSAAR